MVFRDSRRQHDCGRLDHGRLDRRSLDYRSLGIAKFEDENNALPKALRTTPRGETAVQGILNVLLADRAFQYRSRVRRVPLAAQCLPLHHLPYRRRRGDRSLVRVPVRSLDHRPFAAAAGQGPADPPRWPGIAYTLEQG